MDGNGSISIGTIVISIVFIVVLFISNYRIFKKAGKSGWAVVVPIYNLFVLVQIAQISILYFVLFFIPLVGIYALFKVNIEVAHRFGKSTSFGVFMVLFCFIFYPILAFGKSKYMSDNVVKESGSIFNSDDNIIGAGALNSGILDFNNSNQFSSGNVGSLNMNNAINSGDILSIAPVGNSDINNIDNSNNLVNNSNSGVINVSSVIPSGDNNINLGNSDINNIDNSNNLVNNSNSGVINVSSVIPSLSSNSSNELDNNNIVNSGLINVSSVLPSDVDSGK